MVAEVLEALDEALGDAEGVSAVEVFCGEIVVGLVADEDEVGGAQHGGGDGDDGLHGPATSLETEKLGSEIRILDSYRSPSRLYESGFEPAIAGPDACGTMLAGALVVSWTQARPGEQVARGGEPRHVGTDFGEENASGGLAYSWDADEQFELSTKGREDDLHVRFDFAHGRLERIDLSEVKLQEKAVMAGSSAPQGFDQLFATGFEASFGEIDQSFGVRLSSDQASQDGPATQADDIRHYPGDLDVGVFEGLLNPLSVLDDLSSQLLPSTGQVPHLLDGSCGDEATADQPMGQKVRDPHGVVHIGFSAGHVTDVGGDGEDQFEGTLENMPNRLPVNARGLHSCMGTALGLQPVHEGKKVTRGGSERPYLLGHPATLGNPNARYDRVFVNVQTCAPRNKNLHGSHLCGGTGVGSQLGDSLENVLRGQRPLREQYGVLVKSQVQLENGFVAPLQNRPLCRRQAATLSLVSSDWVGTAGRN